MTAIKNLSHSFRTIGIYSFKDMFAPSVIRSLAKAVLFASLQPVSNISEPDILCTHSDLITIMWDF